MREYLGSADPYFTRADEQNGYPETRLRLAGYPDDMLILRYRECLRDGMGAMFGHNARRFCALVVDELMTRGITEIPNIFGPIPVEKFSRVWDEPVNATERIAYMQRKHEKEG